MTEEWTEVEGKKSVYYWAPDEKGQTCIGVFIRTAAEEYKGKPRTRHYLKDVECDLMPEGTPEVCVPDHAVLANLMKSVKIGQRIKIEYIGKAKEAKQGQSKAALYKLYVDQKYVPQASLIDETIANMQPQTRAQPQPQKKKEMSEMIQEFLERCTHPGIHDTRILDVVTQITGTPDAASFLIGMMKQTGKIMQQPDGTWVRT